MTRASISTTSSRPRTRSSDSPPASTLRDIAETPSFERGVERKFAIVGEALSRLAKLDPDLARRVPHLVRIIGFRNVLIHGYGSVDDAQVWRIVQESLPGLRKAVLDLLAELGPPDA